jgi:type I restriction enzyme M protein
MLTDPKLKSQIDQLWDKLWTGGLSNPLDAIEQLSYLLFMKRMDEAEDQREKLARLSGGAYTPSLAPEMRWKMWTQMKADDALKHVKEKVFPALRMLGGADSSFERYMENAELKINRPGLLIEAVKLIDQMQISAQNQDVQGDLYEYLLSKLSQSGINGQFRTPRHIIRMMVEMTKPQSHERIGDMAAGTCGMIVNAYQYILEQHTTPAILSHDEEGVPHNLVGDLLTPGERDWLQTRAFRAFDNDSGMTMLRIGSMNLILHGLTSPQFNYMDTLSKAFDEAQEYDLILMNPPFKGAIDAGEVNPTLPGNTKKTELLFLHLILRTLDMGGRTAVIVPDGVLFGSSKAHQELRRKIIEENRLDGVVSMPSGVFKPYAGVSTAVLLFTRGAATERIWFYDMEHDGFSLDDKRQPVDENDIPDLLRCWDQKADATFVAERAERLAVLLAQIAPLKAVRLRLEKEINRLTFESAIADSDGDASHGALEALRVQETALHEQIGPLQADINQLTRQFWVTKAQVKANKYDLSVSRYRQVEQDEVFYEEPKVTLERLLTLEQVMAGQVHEIDKLLK